jgi:hypothetical protein
MRRAHLLTAVGAVIGALIPTSAAIAQSALAQSAVAQSAVTQSDDARVELIAHVGTPLRVALDKTVSVRRIGQTITGTLIEPLYAYDRLVLPVGTRVVGHVASLENPSKLTRFRAWATGDFAPNRHVTVQFDSLNRDGEVMSLQALGPTGMSNVRRHVAAGANTRARDAPKGDGAVAGGRQELEQKARDSIAAAKQQVSEAIAAIKEPERTERLKLLLIYQLPYHRQYLAKGTVYDAKLQAPLTFGRVDAVPPAVAGASPAPSSILRARLTTTLDSATTARGSRVEAVVTEPVLSAEHQLVVPEGTRLTGEVTVTRRARWFHRNGQLRFLFESVHMPQRETTLLASLHSVDVSADEHLAIDEEGGTRATNSNTRFVAPALAVLALAGAGDGEDHPVSPRHPNGGGGNPGSMSLGGLLGFSVVGAAIAPFSQPLGLALAIGGVARTTYASVVGKGHNVRFEADTPLELELAPGPSPTTSPAK